jgi:GH35 family endo-1,4-beta-xylanase
VSRIDLGFRSAGRPQTAQYFSLPKLVIFVLVLAAVSWYLASTYPSLRNLGGKRERIAQTSDAAPTLRDAAEKHHLQMGAAAESLHLSQAPYAATLAREYSTLEAADEMKFDHIHPEPDSYNFAGPDALVAFAQTHSMKVRGHVLIWHRALPGWIVVRDWMQIQSGPSPPWTPKALNKVLAEHIATAVRRYRGKIYAWDVVNEPFNEDGSMRSSIWYEKPGIGFAGEGTEVDVRLRDDSDSSLRAQAEIYKDLLDTCLREPACTLFQTWGFTDMYSWIPEAYTGYGWALPFDLSYRKKPAYDAMLKRLQSLDNVEPRPKTSREN